MSSEELATPRWVEQFRKEDIVQITLRQSEKLATLGKLSAGPTS